MGKVVLPSLGEGVEKATVSFWYYKEGDAVKEKDDLVEMTTDKATFNMPCPATGTLTKIILHEGETVRVGQTLGEIS